ncbi:MAG: hypothetical protein ACRDSP_04420 [Pseudonocardiaceae bacterium]
MLGASLLTAACLVTLGLVAVAVVLWRRAAGAHSTGRSLAVFAAMSLALVLPGIAFAAVPQADTGAVPEANTVPVEHTTTVRYGPLPLPPDLGGDSAPGGQMVTFVAPTYDMPCRDCYITGLQPGMTYADGSQANYDTGAMLHHMVLFDPTKSDSTCGRQGVGLLSGQRVFASGNERTGAHLPPGYGYRIGATPLGAMAELMNMSPQPQQVYVTMKVSWVDARSTQLKEVTPVWLDINNCGNSQYTVPAGPSHTTWTWKSTMAGDILTIGGHVHDHGVSITLSNATRHEEICKSVAGHNDDPHYQGHIDSMNTCTGDPLATVRKGDDLTIDSYYDSPMRDDTVMGIMIAYLHQT